MKRKLFITLTLCLFAVGTVITTNVSQNDISLEDIRIMAMAQQTKESVIEDESAACPWGYRRYNAWYSGSDGVDCNCNDREDVAGSCS